MFNIENLYRWCDNYGGGLVIASSEEEAREKLIKKYDNSRGELIIWPWTNDDYFDKDNRDVIDIYG